MATAQRPETDDISAARAGDHAAFERIFRAHAPRVHALACWFGHEPDADDITQDVFVLIWRKLRLFDGRSAFTTWLHRVAINAILSRQRRRREPATDFPIVSDPTHTDGTEDRVALDDLIAQLPAEMRHVFVLHDVEGYRHEEIATLLGIPAGTSGSRLHRARQFLRAALNDNA